MAPKANLALWTFRGQCYDQGPHGTQRCVGCNCKPRKLFIIRDEHGKKLTIGACEFELFQHKNPKLYEQLVAAEKWLATTMEAEASDVKVYGVRNQRQEALRVWKEAKRKALARLREYRQQTGKDWLPESLYTVQVEVEKDLPTYKRPSNEIKWLEKQTAKIIENLQ